MKNPRSFPRVSAARSVWGLVGPSALNDVSFFGRDWRWPVPVNVLVEETLFALCRQADRRAGIPREREHRNE